MPERRNMNKHNINNILHKTDNILIAYLTPNDDIFGQCFQIYRIDKDGNIDEFHRLGEGETYKFRKELRWFNYLNFAFEREKKDIEAWLSEYHFNPAI